MKKWNGYDTVEVFGQKRRLPVGNYVCKILGAEEKEYGWGSVLLISFDIAEGEYKNFYKEQYDKQTGQKAWKGVFRVNCPKDNGDPKDEQVKKNFKTFIHHVEKSNAGYKWDWNEASLKGKLVGGVFGEKEYEVDGNTGFFITIRYTTDIKSLDKMTTPKPLMLKRETGFKENTSWEQDEPLPF